MAEPAHTTHAFAGIAIKPGLTRPNYFFLFFTTLLNGMFMQIPTIVHPAFMCEAIGINPDFAGSIDSFLHTMSRRVRSQGLDRITIHVCSALHASKP